MGLKCIFGRHAAAAGLMWNAGHYFSKCTHCRCDLIRGRGASGWDTVPRGYRIVWKQRTENDVDWNAANSARRRAVEGGSLTDLVLTMRPPVAQGPDTLFAQAAEARRARSRRPWSPNEATTFFRPACGAERARHLSA